jgi:hypothetical protein
MKKFYVIFALFTLVSLTVTAQPQLTWRFNNVEVINAGTQLQFDVEVMANAGGSYQRDLQIYFDYNTLGFGSNIVANGKITYSPLTLLDATRYVVVNMADNTSSKFAIITEAINEMTQPGSSTYYREVTTSYQGLLRFTINIASNTQTAGIAFDEALMNGGQYYQSTTNTDPIKYQDPSLYANPLSTLLLSSVYGTITYNNVPATPLKLCTLTLTGGDTYGPTLNDGKYYFTGMVDGAYAVAGTCTNTWGGMTTFDATLILRYAGGVPGFGLTNLQKRAADVNMTNTAGGVTTFDATLILRKATLPPGTFPPQWTAPSFVFDGPYPATPALSGYPVTVSNGLGNANFKALCSGDVNGSYVTIPTE